MDPGFGWRGRQKHFTRIFTNEMYLLKGDIRGVKYWIYLFLSHEVNFSVHFTLSVLDSTLYTSVMPSEVRMDFFEEKLEIRAQNLLLNS